jgi:hypothetical protein
MSIQSDWDFAGDDDARAEIGAAVKYLLKDATDNRLRGDIVWKIIETVHDVANSLVPPQHPDSPDTPAAKPPAMSGIVYKAFVIDAFRRDTDKWRATIRRLDGKKIRVAFPHAVLDEATTSTDVLTAEKAVELAKKAIDGGGLT